jgi:hypothetical protein
LLIVILQDRDISSVTGKWKMEITRVGSKVRCAVALIGSSAALISTGTAQGGLLFKSAVADSRVIYTHDVLEFNGPADRTATTLVPTGTPVSFLLTDATLTNLVTVKSEARAAVGQATGVSSATAVFKSGTLLTQSDPNNAGGTTFSTLNIDFFLKWDVTGAGFGPPVSGAFSIPIQATVAAGGAAKAQVQVDWGLEDKVTHVFTPLRSQFATTQTYTTTTLTSLSVPSAAFSPSAMPITSFFVVKGFLKLSAENNTAPTRIYAQPDYVNDMLDLAPTTYFKFDNATADFPDLGSSGGTGIGSFVEHTAGVDSLGIGISNNAHVSKTIQTTNDFSLTSWAKVGVNGSGNAVDGSRWFGNAFGAGGFEFGPAQGTNLIQFVMYDAAGNPHVVASAPGLALDAYHMYTATYDSASDTATVLIDGQVVASLAGLGFLRFDGAHPVGGSLSLFAGATGLSPEATATGELDEFGLFDRALATHEVLGLSQLGHAQLEIPDSLNAFAGAFISDDVVGTVPEPTGLAVLGAGLVGVMGRRRR